MKILPIDSNCKPSFNAKFPKKEAMELVEFAKKDKDNAGIPKLYTLLDLLDKFPGKIARFKTKTVTSQYRATSIYEGSYFPSTTYNSLCVDNVEIKKKPISKYNVLYRAMTDYKTKDGEYIPMPESIWNSLWWKNRDKTVKDIEKFILHI